MMCGDDDHEGYSCMKHGSACTIGPAWLQMLEPSKMGRKGAWLHKEVMEGGERVRENVLQKHTDRVIYLGLSENFLERYLLSRSSVTLQFPETRGSSCNSHPQVNSGDSLELHPVSFNQQEDSTTYWSAFLCSF